MVITIMVITIMAINTNTWTGGAADAVTAGIADETIISVVAMRCCGRALLVAMRV